MLHGNAAGINMPSSSPSDSGDLTAVSGGFISPACGYKCELMQVAAIKLVNDFASGGSLETNVLQFNATARVHSEYQVICEGGKCVAKQSHRTGNNHTAAVRASITQSNLNSERKALPHSQQSRLWTHLALFGNARDLAVIQSRASSPRDLCCCNLLFADLHGCTEGAFDRTKHGGGAVCSMLTQRCVASAFVM